MTEKSHVTGTTPKVRKRMTWKYECSDDCQKTRMAPAKTMVGWDLS